MLRETAAPRSITATDHLEISACRSSPFILFFLFFLFYLLLPSSPLTLPDPPIPNRSCPELPGQLTFTTSSLKKRKISRPSRRGDDTTVLSRPQIHQHPDEPQQHAQSAQSAQQPQHRQLPLPAASPRPVDIRQTRRQHRGPDDIRSRSRLQQPILPSTEREEEEEEEDRNRHAEDEDDENSSSDEEEEDDDDNSSDFNPTFSFSAASNAASSGPTTPTYSRAGSVPLPPTRSAATLGYVEDHDDSETTTPDADADRDASSITSSPPPRSGIATTSATLTKGPSARKARSGRRATRRAAATSALPSSPAPTSASASASALASAPASAPTSASAADTISQRRRKIQQRRNGTPSSLHPPLPSHRHTQQRYYERSQSPLVPVSHRAIIMGGTNDLPSHRSSSPLKRTASSMEQASENNSITAAGSSEAPTANSPTTSPSQTNSSSSQQADTKEDVDMVTVAPSDKAEDTETETGTETETEIEADARPTDAANNTQAASPPIEEQIRTIEGLVKAFNAEELDEGTAAYLVSRRWLARAQALGSGDAVKAAKEAPQGALGPVDNADIVDSLVQDIDGGRAVRLKAGTSQEDFEYFSKEAWDLLVSWHGLAKGQMPIIRYAHNTAPNSMIPNVQYELHPPVFTLHRLWSMISTISHTKEVPDTAQAAPVIMCTSNYNVQAFLRRAKTLLHIPMERHVRIWSVPRKLAAGNTPLPGPVVTVSSLGASLSTPPDSPRLGPGSGNGNGNGSGSGSGDGNVTNPQDSWSKMLLEVTDFMKLQSNVERELLSQVKDLTHDENFNGQRTLAFISLTVDQTIVLDENIERNLFVSTYNLKVGGKDKGKAGHHGASTAASSSSTLVGIANTAASRTGGANSTAASSGRSSPNHAGPMTRGRTKQKSGRTMGCVGLGNLGNTCYMNAALQCLRSVEELTKYFLVHENEVEINHSNPLGYGGNVANAYAYLLEEIFRENVPMSIAPRQFKSTIGRYAPAFAGYGQQDSQEFLGFLLDGLQEDLSRVKKKPYIEKPDSTDEMIGNPAAIREMADKVWDITKRRDDSIIADLFTGMYKSTLICPVCQKVSITFDPFTNLTLPLPIQNVWSKTIRFVPLNDRPVYMDVELDKTSSVRAFKEFISVRVGVPAERLVGAEELRDNIIRVYDDFECVSEEMATNDSVLVFEVESAPTNNSGSKMPRKKPRSMLLLDNVEPEIPAWDSPMAARLLVPVIHRFDPSQRRRYPKSNSLASPPHFIVLTPDEARSEDVIRRKILEKVASYSTWTEFAKAEHATTAQTQAASASTSTSTSASADESSEESHRDDATDATDNDLVVTSASDVDSAGNSKVIAKSVEGEDDMVDVTMKDAGAGGETTNQGAESKVLYKFSRHRPKWVTDPSVFLAGELQNLFDLGYFDDASNVIPIKWSGPTDEKPYPKILSRVPQAPARTPAKRSSSDRDMNSPGPWESAGGSDDESRHEEDAPEEDAPEEDAVRSDLTRMADESEDDEETAVPPAIALRDNNLPKSGPARRKALKAHQKMYGVKGAKRRQRLAQASANRPPPRHVSDEDDNDERDNDNDNDMEAASPPSSSSASASAPPAPPVITAPLIRLGEGIMVDWSADGWDAVFGKEGPDDNMRGEPTFEDPIPVVDDPELQEKRRNRISRKKRGLTLDECLDEFEREEILSENDMWYCPRCKEHRRASKKFDLWKTPDILVVHLKRFSSSGWRRDKLDMRVDFPVEGLDITKRVLDRQTGKEEVYDLIGVDDHWGGLGGGHYTAFAKNFIDDQWYEYNDSSVSRVNDTSRVVSAAAYLLFYRRRSEVPLGGPRFQKIEDKFGQEATTSDEDMSESGEGRRLDTGSSLIGSSSASKGAEAGRRRRVSPGLASSGTSSLTINANGGGAPLSSPMPSSALRSGGDDDNDNDDDDDDEYLPPYAPVSRGPRGINSSSSTRDSKNLRIRALAVDSSDEHDGDTSAIDSGDLHSRLVGTASVLNFGESRGGGSGGGGGYRHHLDDGDNGDNIRKSVEMDELYPGGLNSSSSLDDSAAWTQQSWSFGPAAADAGGVRNSPGSDVADVDELELGDADAATATGSASGGGRATATAAQMDPDRMSMGTADADYHQADMDLSFLEGAVPVVGLGGAGSGRGARERAGSQTPPPPPPDAFTQANMEDIQQQVWARNNNNNAGGNGRIHTITLSDNADDPDSDNAVDIHISEDEAAKMDD